MDKRLVEEVLDHAPADLTPAERMVLVVLARYADLKTRECWPPPDLIARQSGLKADSLRKTFQRLAARNLEVRVVIDKDRNGRPVFAHKGRKTLYRLPRFAPEQRRDEIPTFEGPKAGPDSRLSAQRRDEVPTFEAQSRDDSPTFESESTTNAGPKAGISSRPNKQAGNASKQAAERPSRDAFAALGPLQDRMTAEGMTASWTMRAEQVGELVDLINRVGVPALVEHARRSWRKDNPPTYITALMRGWSGLPSAPAATAPTHRSDPEPDWCGACDNPGYRFVETDGRWYRCPDCNPGAPT
ncbi:helix-turn-helix domain-containing protein [Embleya sp. NPDC020630]|uniref:helix-turn-helix domain-containing protein n=1 Tax=Embleya sp. NPDC020630 TaxID=3363979 RepID=UPI0037B67A1A